MYDREWDRRKELDSAIGLPITILTILGAVLLFFIKEIGNVFFSQCMNLFSYVTISGVLFTLFSLCTSVFWLVGSFNFFFKGFTYFNVGSVRGVRRVEKVTLPKKSVTDKQEYAFEDILIDKLSYYTDKNKLVNIRRGNYLYLARKWIIISLISIVVLYLLLIFKNLLL